MAAAEIEKLTPMRIGCDMAVWAPVTKDDSTELTYGAVKTLPGLMSLGINPNIDSASAFYDDGPGETASTLGEIEVTVAKSALGTKEKATLLGHGYIEATDMLVYGAADAAPWGALGFRTLQSNGTYRYVWLLKGKFQDSSETNETRGESVNFQNDELVGKFVKTVKQFTFSSSIDEGTTTAKSRTVQPWKTEVNEANATADKGKKLIAKWFNAPVTPATTTT